LMERSGETGVTDGERYTVFSLWDTCRNLHQLLTLVYPDRQREMLRSMTGMYEEWGWLPKWELYGRETFTMEGDPAIPVIVDSWMKGLRDFDVAKAYEAMRKSATTPGAQNRMRPDLDPYIEKGYIPLGFYAKDLAGDTSVSHALEYYMADAALSLLADSLGHGDDARLFRARSLGYKRYYSPESGTLRPLHPDGAMRKSATTPGAQNRMRPDLDPYIEKGYIPLGFYAKDLAGDTSVSHALEYYMADAALSLLADSLGHGDDARLFRARSLGYKRYYSPESGTLRPLHPDGSFLSPFDPKAGENFTAAPGFHEGSAWNYTFYVPHDVEGLAKLMGGRRKFIDKLQMVFDEGLYDPANEPDIAYAYLFSRFRGEEWRTQRETRRLLERYFTTAPDGIPGNDDTGTMSAWAVFTMLGLYPDCPGEPYYTLTSPTFDRVEIDTERGTLVIEKRGEGYIDRMTLGDKPLKNYRILHDELLKGGKLTFELQTGK
ncbi:glycoside hydrolase family 92 protein, partial [Alistipes onderdonkii]